MASRRIRPHFTFQGFRYAAVTVEGDASLESIEFVPISSVSEATAASSAAIRW